MFLLNTHKGGKMTKGIEDMLNLPRMEDALKETNEHPYINVDTIEFPDVDAFLQNNLEKDTDAVDHENAMDRIFDETIKHANDLIEMAYNVDVPRARGIFEQANAMYSRAIDAKNSKRDAQLKLYKLMLDKKKIEVSRQKQLPVDPSLDNTAQTTDSIVVEDRNTLIQMIRSQMEAEKN